MFDVFIFANVEMPLTGIEMAFYMLQNARSQSNKTVLHAFVREFSKQFPTATQIFIWRKKIERKVVCAGEDNQDGQSDIRGDGRAFS